MFTIIIVIKLLEGRKTSMCMLKVDELPQANKDNNAGREVKLDVNEQPPNKKLKIETEIKTEILAS